MVTRTRAWLSALERRPVTRANRVGAWIAIATCPCHAGWLLALTSGTAIGAALAPWGAWLYAAFGIAFVLGLGVLFQRGSSTCDRCSE